MHLFSSKNSEEEIGHLAQRTEGWVAGLQLAALSMRRHPDRSSWISAFTGSHRLILDYVQQEILEPLPEGLQRFLLQTSVLDRMNAEVCQRLSGEQAWIKQLPQEVLRAHPRLATSYMLAFFVLFPFSPQQQIVSKC